MKKIDVDLQIAGITVKGTLYVHEDKVEVTPKDWGTQYGFHFPDNKPIQEIPQEENSYDESEPIMPLSAKINVLNSVKKRICTEVDCFNRAVTRGYCSKHYQRVWKQERGGEN